MADIPIVKLHWGEYSLNLADDKLKRAGTELTRFN